MKVSIGIPVYNNASTLMKTLKSIFAQTLQDWELILFDDGSSDGSLELLQAVEHPRVRLFSDGLNRGMATRLNQIASLARSDLLARMDADDMMHPERLWRQVQFLTEHPEVELLGTAIYSIDHNDEILGIRGHRTLNTEPSRVVTRGLFAHPTVTGRTSWFLENPYDELFRRAQDRDLWCRTVSHTIATTLTTPLLFYREHDLSIEKIRLHMSTDRRILARYGPAVLGYPGTVVQFFRSWLKGCICRAVCTAGGGRYLIRRRNRPLSTKEYTDATNCINGILAKTVPGVGRLNPGIKAA